MAGSNCGFHRRNNADRDANGLQIQQSQQGLFRESSVIGEWPKHANVSLTLQGKKYTNLRAGKPAPFETGCSFQIAISEHPFSGDLLLSLEIEDFLKHLNRVCSSTDRVYLKAY